MRRVLRDLAVGVAAAFGALGSRRFDQDLAKAEHADIIGFHDPMGKGI
jgi:hypothetical protein